MISVKSVQAAPGFGLLLVFENRKTKGHPLCFTGRSLHPGKRGQIAERIPKLQQRLAIDPERFIDCATDLMMQTKGHPLCLTGRRSPTRVKP